MKTIEELQDAQDKLNNDPEVQEALETLKAIYKKKFYETFDFEKIDDDLWDEFTEDIYEADRECKPDEVSVFMGLWYNV